MRGVSYKKVQEVWAAGNIEAREKIKYTEGGSFIGGVAGGASGVIMQQRPHSAAFQYDRARCFK